MNNNQPEVQETEAKEAKNGKKKRSVPSTPYHRVMPVILFALAIVTTISLIKDGSLLGLVGNAIHDVLLGFFGGAAYLVPFFLATMAITRRRDIENGARLGKWIVLSLFTVMLGAVLFVFGIPAEEQATAYMPNVAFQNGCLSRGGGVIGSLAGYGLLQAVAIIGVVILFVVVTLLFLICYFGFDPRVLFVFLLKKLRPSEEKIAQRKQRKAEKKARIAEEKARAAEDRKKARIAASEARKKEKACKQGSLARTEPVTDAPTESTVPEASLRREHPDRSPFVDDPDLADAAPPFLGVRPEPLQPRKTSGSASGVSRPEIDGTLTGGTLTDYPLDNDIFFTDPDSSDKMQPLRPERGEDAANGIDTSLDYINRRRAANIASRENDLREKNPRTLSDFARITTTAPAPTDRARMGGTRENVGGYDDRPLEGEDTTSSFFRASGRHARAAEAAARMNGYASPLSTPSPAPQDAEAMQSDTPVGTTERNSFGNVTQYAPSEPKAQPASDRLTREDVARLFPDDPDDIPIAAEEENDDTLPPWETAPRGTASVSDGEDDGDTLPPSKNPAVFKNPYLAESVSSTPDIDTKEYSRPVGVGTAKPEPPPYSPFATPAPTRTSPVQGGYSSQAATVTSYYGTPGGEGKKQGFDFSRYRYPDISFLTPPDLSDDSSLDAEVEANMESLIRTLKSYGVEAQPRSTTRGPRITRYEIVPALGVRINAITNLQNEIAMNLRAESLRIEAPIPGDSAIGIEVPNKTSKPVRLRALIESDAFRQSPSTTTVALGADIAGKQIFASIADMPHLLVAGATGMGKSVCINTLITSLLYKARPDEVRLILVDPKMVEFNIYQGIPHLLVPVINNAKQALGALNWAAEEMDRRFSLISRAGVRDLDGYASVRAQNPDMEPLPRIIIVIDELNDLILSLKNSKPLDDVICRIAQKARAAGVHLILGTQRPTVNVLTGNIKANIPARIAFKVAQKVDSTTIIDCVGAEKLLDKGDMLYMKSSKMRRIQCCLVGSKEIDKVVSFLRANTDGDTYDHSAMAGIDRATSAADQEASKDVSTGMQDTGGHVGPEERKFWEAVDLATGSGKIATSLLQRKLSIGYGKAAKLIDKMEELGIVSAQDERKPREILLSPDEINELRARLAGRALFSVGDDEDDGEE